MALIGVIETNPVIAAHWRERLGCAGWNVRHWPAPPIGETLHDQVAADPTVWIVNLGLGKLSGIAAAQAITRAYGQSVPLLLYTGQACVSTEESRQAFEAGAWGLLCGTQAWSAARDWLRSVSLLTGRSLSPQSLSPGRTNFSPLLGTRTSPPGAIDGPMVGDTRCVMGIAAAATAVAPARFERLRRWSDRTSTLARWAGHSLSQARAARLAVLAQSAHLLWPERREQDLPAQIDIRGAPSPAESLLSSLSPGMMRLASDLYRVAGHPDAPAARSPSAIDARLPEILQLILLARSLELLLSDWLPGEPLVGRRRLWVERWIAQCLDSPCTRRLRRRLTGHVGYSTHEQRTH